MEKSDFVLWISAALLIGALLTLLITIIPFRSMPSSLLFKINGYTEDNALKFCSGKDLKDTSYCLNAFVRGVFNYEDTNPKNFQELISNGGVCCDYNKFYRTMLRRLGFETEDIDVSWKTELAEDWGNDEDAIYLGDGYGRDSHIYLYTFDEDSSDKIICILDQIYINCRDFNN